MDRRGTRVIYLVRHGKIVQRDDQRRYIGQVDVPLSAEGRTQARQLADRFAGTELGTIYASDLSRAQETAEIVAQRNGSRVALRPELREIAMGEWEGRAFGEIAAASPEAYKARGEDLAGFRAPGGETFTECHARAVHALDEILTSTDGPILIVAHAGPNRLLLCHMLGMPIASLFRIAQDYACLNVIQHGAAGFQVKLMNGRARTGRR
jgi:alpha-ribazole phosphatase